MRKFVIYLWSSLLLLLIVWIIFASHIAGWDAMKLPSAILAIWIIVPASILYIRDRRTTKKRMGKYWKNATITNATFGEIEYRQTEWRTTGKFDFSLFDRTYNVDVIALVDGRAVEEVNDLQESAFRTFKEIIVRDKPDIEKAITDHFNKVSAIEDFNCRYHEGYDLTNIPARFVPSSIDVTRKGEVAIYVCDDAEEYGEYDDWDEGFVITILPTIEIVSKEFYDGHVSSGRILSR